MKTISDYTIYCTEEQTGKAVELGAPINNSYYGICCDPTEKIGLIGENHYAIIPTAEQMISWLEKEKSISVEVSRQYGINKYCYYIFDNYGNDIESLESKIKFNSRKDAVLAGIDIALKYITNYKNA